MLSKKELAIVITCCGMMISSFGIFYNVYGVFYTPLCNAFNASKGAIGVHNTIFGISLGLSSPFTIRLLRRFNVRIITVSGILVGGATMMVMPFLRHLSILYILAAVRGIAVSCFALAVVSTIIGNWFRKGEGKILGIVVASCGMGGIVLSPLITYFITHFGFVAACIITGVIVIALPLPGCIICLELKRKNPTFAENVCENTGFKPNARFSVFSVLFFCVILAQLMSSISVGATSHMVGFAEESKMGSTVGALLISFVMGGNIVSKYIAGLLSDKIGIYKAFAIILGVDVFGILLLIAAKEYLLVEYLAAFLYGGIHSANSLGSPLLVRSIYGNEQYPKVFSYVSAVSCVAASVSVAAIGYIFDATGSYNLAFLIVAGLMTVNLIIWLYVKAYSSS